MTKPTEKVRDLMAALEDSLAAAKAQAAQRQKADGQEEQRSLTPPLSGSSLSGRPAEPTPPSIGANEWPRWRPEPE